MARPAKAATKAPADMERRSAAPGNADGVVEAEAVGLAADGVATTDETAAARLLAETEAGRAEEATATKVLAAGAEETAGAEGAGRADEAPAAGVLAAGTGRSGAACLGRGCGTS